MMTPGQRRGRRRQSRRRLVPRGAPDPRRVPAQAAAAVRARQRGRRRRPLGAGRRAVCARRPRGRVLHARGVRRGRRRAGAFCLHAPRPARLRPGRRAGPQLPHRLLRAEACAGGSPGGDGARARGGGRRRHRRAPGRQGPRCADDRRRLERSRRSASRARPAPTRSFARTGPGRTRRKELSGGGRRHRDRSGRRGSLHRQPAVAARGRPRGGRRLHWWVDPRGEGQPPAARATPR